MGVPSVLSTVTTAACISRRWCRSRRRCSRAWRSSSLRTPAVSSTAAEPMSRLSRGRAAAGRGAMIAHSAIRTRKRRAGFPANRSGPAWNREQGLKPWSRMVFLLWKRVKKSPGCTESGRDQFLRTKPGAMMKRPPSSLSSSRGIQHRSGPDFGCAQTACTGASRG